MMARGLLVCCALLIALMPAMATGEVVDLLIEQGEVIFLTDMPQPVPTKSTASLFSGAEYELSALLHTVLFCAALLCVMVCLLGVRVRHQERQRRAATLFGTGLMISLAVTCTLGYGLAEQMANVSRVNGEYQRLKQTARVRHQADAQALAPAVVLDAPEGQYATGSLAEWIDFDGLCKLNEDIVAWISIPGTTVDYPVVQGQNNDAYRNKTVLGGQSRAGSIFLDAECEADLSGKHILVYGRSMADGTMFATLSRYQNKQFWQEHPAIELHTPQGTRTLTVISAYTAADTTFQRRMSFDEVDFLTYKKQLVSDSIVRMRLEYKLDEIAQLYTFVAYPSDKSNTCVWVHAAELA